eukprot:EC714622.1.p1 GENE.EC714622.1~~EC714622.1.p1  ORF type:complete len:132 (-),score=21.65 EC714622.1:41-436(-)
MNRPLSASIPKRASSAPRARPSSAAPTSMGRPVTPVQRRSGDLQSDDEVDVEKIFEELASNPFLIKETKQKRSELEMQALKAANKTKKILADDRAATYSYLRDVQKRTKDAMERIASYRGDLVEQTAKMGA